MAVTGSDVPGRYDVVLANVITSSATSLSMGFVLLSSLESSLPFRTHRAIYDISPTFITRANSTGLFGDNQQDFWLTMNQEDWSLGEDQKFYRANDADRIRRFWQGTNVDNRIPGQVTIRPAAQTVSLSSSCTSGVGALTSGAASCLHLFGTHDLFEISPNGTFVSKGEHGLGATPSAYGTAHDGINTYYTAGTASLVRSFTGTGYAAFSGSQADSLAFLNNTLYGFRKSQGDLIQYDTAGAVTSLFTWKTAKGSAISTTASSVKMIPFGGKLEILRMGVGDQGTSEVWTYDGVGVSKLHQFEPNFSATDIAASYGVIYVSGALQTSNGATIVNYPCIFYIANGTIGMLWKSTASTTSSPAGPPLCTFDGGLAWPDYINSQYLYYNPATGGVTRIGSVIVSGTTTPVMVAGRTNFAHFGTTTNADLYPNVASVASSASITSSLYDFDTSLNKVFRGIKVEFASASDGDGGSVAIGYRTNDVTGTVTTVSTAASSGTEYLLTGVTGRNLSPIITLNKGTSTNGPTFRRLYVRAAPQLQQFRSGFYVLELIDNVTLRDNMPHPLTANEQMQNLLAAAKTSTPFTVTDKMGTFTALVDLQDPEGFDIYEVHPLGHIQPPTLAGAYVARVKLREV